MFGISAFAEIPFASLPYNVTTGLTGDAASGAVGSVAATQSAALSGVNASGLVDSVTAVRSVALTGVVASGSVSGFFSANLTGDAASGLVGTVTGEASFALTGDAASGLVGSVAVGARLVALTGVRAAGSAGTAVAINWLLIDDDTNANWQLINTVN
jgi:hypothetical protein